MSDVTRVKICGITRVEDGLLAAQLGAWALGFIFAEGSPRQLSVARARELIARLPANILKVGVFVDASLDLIHAAADAGITVAQLHGKIPAGVLKAGELPYIIARAPSNREELLDLAQYTGANALLIDGHVLGLQGGTGVAADPALAIAAKKFHPRVILAGGLRPDNVRAAVRAVEPFAVDASSGLESAPGVKDPEKLKAFFEALKVPA